MKGLYLLCFFIVVGFSAIPLLAQDQTVTYQPSQKSGQSTTTTREEKVQPDGTKTTKETSATESQGSSYKYSGIPGKFTRTGGQSHGQGQLAADRESRNTYHYDIRAKGLPKDSDPTKAYWFERQDGKLVLIDPVVTQRYQRNP